MKTRRTHDIRVRRVRTRLAARLSVKVDRVRATLLRKRLSSILEEASSSGYIMYPSIDYYYYYCYCCCLVFFFSFGSGMYVLNIRYTTVGDSTSCTMVQRLYYYVIFVVVIDNYTRISLYTRSLTACVSGRENSSLVL